MCKTDKNGNTECGESAVAAARTSQVLTDTRTRPRRRGGRPVRAAAARGRTAGAARRIPRRGADRVTDDHCAAGWFCPMCCVRSSDRHGVMLAGRPPREPRRGERARSLPGGGPERTAPPMTAPKNTKPARRRGADAAAGPPRGGGRSPRCCHARRSRTRWRGSSPSRSPGRAA